MIRMITKVKWAIVPDINLVITNQIQKALINGSFLRAEYVKDDLQALRIFWRVPPRPTISPIQSRVTIQEAMPSEIIQRRSRRHTRFYFSVTTMM